MIGWTQTLEDQYNYKISHDYVSFIKKEPWYKYDFKKALWWLYKNDISLFSLRSLERRIVLSINYTLKWVYAKLMRRWAEKTYKPERLSTIVTTLSWSILKIHEVRRYQDFTEDIQDLVASGYKIDTIEWNKYILMDVITNTGNIIVSNCQQILSIPVLSSDNHRVVLECKNNSLDNILKFIYKQWYSIEHIYDY
jgi:hypothetical protein